MKRFERRSAKEWKQHHNCFMWRSRVRPWNKRAVHLLSQQAVPCIRRYHSSSHRGYLALLFTSLRNIQQFLWSPEPTSIRIAQSDDIHNELRKKEEDRKEESMEDLQYRYSLVHAHPLGPWQAILNAVILHYSDWEMKNSSLQNNEKQSYSVLDVACGPRGEPGTTIANALPLVNVHCTDSCAVAIDSVPVVCMDVLASSGAKCNEVIDPLAVVKDPSPRASRSRHIPWKLPPSNLSKSVCNLDQLNSHFPPNSMNAIVCCYGYGLSTNVVYALEQAYTVLLPGGILVLGTWNYSPLLALGHDMLTTLRSGTGDAAAMLLVQQQNDLDIGLPLSIRPAPVIEHSGPGEWESMLNMAGFNPADIVSSCHKYPMNMGSTKVEQFNLGTLLIRDELQLLKAFDDRVATSENGPFLNSAEEAFWSNVPQYCDEPPSRGANVYNAPDDDTCDHAATHHWVSNTSNEHFVESNTMWMPNNTFTLTVSTK